jgi:hypothetical protein
MGDYKNQLDDYSEGASRFEPIRRSYSESDSFNEYFNLDQSLFNINRRDSVSQSIPIRKRGPLIPRVESARNFQDTDSMMNYHTKTKSLTSIEDETDILMKHNLSILSESDPLETLFAICDIPPPSVLPIGNEYNDNFLNMTPHNNNASRSSLLSNQQLVSNSSRPSTNQPVVSSSNRPSLQSHPVAANSRPSLQNQSLGPSSSRPSLQNYPIATNSRTSLQNQPLASPNRTSLNQPSFKPIQNQQVLSNTNRSPIHGVNQRAKPRVASSMYALTESTSPVSTQTLGQLEQLLSDISTQYHDPKKLSRISAVRKRLSSYNPESIIAEKSKLTDDELLKLDSILTEMEKNAGLKGGDNGLFLDDDGVEEVLDLLEVMRLEEDENRQLMNLEDLLSNI